MEHIMLSVFDYSGNKMCELYDSENAIIGQAYDITFTEERGGMRELTFTLPRTVDATISFLTVISSAMWGCCIWMR